MPPLKVDLCLAAGRLILLVLNACCIKHLACCLCGISIMIFVVEINHFADTLLDQSLGAFIAREKRDINRRTGKISGL